MPYKVVGKTVQVKKDGKWKKLKTHTSAAKAKAHKTALQMNVKHG